MKYIFCNYAYKSGCKTKAYEYSELTFTACGVTHEIIRGSSRLSLRIGVPKKMWTRYLRFLLNSTEAKKYVIIDPTDI